MTLNNPSLITIKILAVGGAPSVKDVTAALSQFGSVMQYEAANLVFDGNGLVPAPAPDVGLPASISPAPTVKAKKGGIKPEKQHEVVRKVQAAQATKRAKEKQEAKDDGEPKPINLAEGSNPHKIFEFIRAKSSCTSTQIREGLGLDSNIVNTTVYRLKGAGMIRPMSYNAPNGDTLYTSTEYDPKRPTPASTNEEV